MADEPFDSAWAVLKRDMHDITNDMSPEERNARYQSNIRNQIAQQAEEQKRAEIEAANAEVHRQLQAQQEQPVKISNFMQDSAEDMVRNNPTANLAHPSGNLPGVPPLYTKPLDLSMESLRENKE